MLNPGPIGAQPQSLPKDFSATDYYYLADYRKERFPNYEPYIAYALVSKNAEGQRVAHQFEFPYVADPRLPKVKRLKEISFGSDGKNNNIHAITTDGEELTTNRSIQLETHNLGPVPAHFELCFFSPISTENKLQAKLWKTEESSSDEDFSETQAEESEPSVVRGGQLNFDWSDILSRLKASPILSEQNDVIVHSARRAYYNHWETNRNKLSPEMQQILRRTFQKDMSDPFMAPEWCHALAKQFHHVNSNPQYVNNLGAAPKWINSKMMVVESAARWYAKTYPEAKISLVSHFNMLGKSDVVKNGHMEATIGHGQKGIKISQDLKPHQKVPVYSQATDRALATFVIDSLFQAKTPTRIPTNNDNILLADSDIGTIANPGHEQAPFLTPFKITLNDRFDTVFATKADNANKDNPLRQTYLENLREYQYLMLNTLTNLLQEVSRGQYQNFRTWLQQNDCTYLDLSYDKARNINLYHLGQALRGTKVSTLDLSNNIIDEENGIYFGRMFKGTPISNVILKDRSSQFTMDRRRISRITAAGACAFARGLKGSLVEMVDFNGNQFGHQGAIDVLRELRDSPLKNLCLSNNDVNAAEMTPLVSCIDGTCLENIDFGFENPALQNALQKNKMKNQRAIEKKQEAKPAKYKSRLFVGEGDFSFTTAFLKKHENKKGLAGQVTATCFESREDVWKIYDKTSLISFNEYRAKQKREKNSECEVVYNVDARTLHENQDLAGKRFQRIHFNLPHDGNSYDEPSLTLMIHEFFQSARKLQKDGDRILMALPSPAHDRSRHYIEGYAYSLFVITASAGYKLIKKRNFGPERYPGYQPVSSDDRHSPLCEYVFERTNLSYGEIYKVTPPHFVPLDERMPNGRELICLTQMEMDDDSSDCEDDAAIGENEIPPEQEQRPDCTGTLISLRNLHSGVHIRSEYEDNDPEYIRKCYPGSSDDHSNSSDPDREWSSRKNKNSHRSAKKIKYEDDDNPESYSESSEEYSDSSEVEQESISSKKRNRY